MLRKKAIFALSALAIALPLGAVIAEPIYRHGLRGGPISVSTADNPLDLTPDAFVIPPVNGAPTSDFVVSASVTPTGFTGTVPITVSGTGTPGVRVAGASSYTSIDTIAPGQSFEVGLYTSAAHSTAHVATVTIGAVSANFVVTTAAVAAVAFDIPDMEGIPPATAFTQSAEVFPSGLGGYGASVCVYDENGTLGGQDSRILAIPGSGSTAGCNSISGPDGGFRVLFTSPPPGETHTFTVRLTPNLGGGATGAEVVDTFTVSTEAGEDLDPDVLPDRLIKGFSPGSYANYQLYSPQGFSAPTIVVAGGAGSPQLQLPGQLPVPTGQSITLNPGQGLNLRVQTPTVAGEINTAYVYANGSATPFITLSVQYCPIGYTCP